MRNNFEELINLLKKNGFIFQGSEIYGGLSNTWDYGPLGVEMKNNLKKMWWNYFIKSFNFNFGIDSSILLNSKVWKSSGHIDKFSDPLIDCKECKFRFRPDKLLENKLGKKNFSSLDNKELEKEIKQNNIKCPKCNKKNFTNIKNFELMFKINENIIDSKKNNLYLRPETAQGIFINFKNIQQTTKNKLPIGIGQIGKSFRNEITPGNFIFRTKEFEQMELEFFYSKYDKKNWFEFWLNKVKEFLFLLGINKKNIFFNEHSKKELAHYSSKTIDINYKFPFGIGELWGISNRKDYDLNLHSKNSKVDLKYYDEEKKEKYFPYVIEPSVGVERLLLAIICESYTKEVKDDKERIYLKINKFISPYQIAILPLVKKFNDNCQKIIDKFQLNNVFNIHTNDSGSIGKRYRKEDLIGTPYCITFDYQSLEDNMITVRERDSMKQERIKIEEIKKFLYKKFNFL